MHIFKKVLVTGGAGFIGGSFIRDLLLNSECELFNLDKLGYASDLSSIHSIKSSESRHKHLNIDLVNNNEIYDVIKKIGPELIIHFAAESHVDRSINNPSHFVQSNILGTFNLLEATRKYWENLNIEKKKIFRFHHISTDEVFGTLASNEYFDESSRYYPRSPYSASKAASDHLVRSWYHTYGLPIIITNCSNNYGPYQFPEKLIPLTILKALKNEEIPIYGNGSNQRDWIYVNDHVQAIKECLLKGNIGETYCIGGNAIKTNLEVVNLICEILFKLNPRNNNYKNLITFVKDRPGHDERYAINTYKISSELNWKPSYSFEKGLEMTVKWYLNNISWCETIMKKSNYKGNRLGL